MTLISYLSDALSYLTSKCDLNFLIALIIEIRPGKWK